MIQDAPEYYIFREGLNVSHFGLRAAQNRIAFDGLSILLDEVKPRQIIELGAGQGGLTIMLGIWARINGALFHSYELSCPLQLPELHEPLGIGLFAEDCMGKEASARIATVAQMDGVTLILCDNGNKRTEFARFQGVLKKGDIIMSHDFSDPERSIGSNYWGWSEFTPGDATPYSVKRVYRELLEYGAWGAYEKL